MLSRSPSDYYVHNLKLTQTEYSVPYIFQMNDTCGEALFHIFLSADPVCTVDAGLKNRRQQ